MDLQGRDLSTDMQGDDVKLLHNELRQLSFAISDNELQESHFGNDTAEAGRTFQRMNGLLAWINTPRRPSGSCRTRRHLGDGNAGAIRRDMHNH